MPSRGPLTYFFRTKKTRSTPRPLASSSTTPAPTAILRTWTVFPSHPNSRCHCEIISDHQRFPKNAMRIETPPPHPRAMT
jgi:hypothetical protein